MKKSKDTTKKFTPLAVGIYNSGQLFLEEYYTLSMIAHAKWRLKASND